MTTGDRAARRLIRGILGDGEGPPREQDVESINFRVRRAEEDLGIVRDALAALELRASGSTRDSLAIALSNASALQSGLATLMTQIKTASTTAGLQVPAQPPTPPARPEESGPSTPGILE